MSRTPLIKEFKHKNNYVADGERCENCHHYKNGYTKLINSIPKAERPYCKLGEFYTNKLGICNEWNEAILRKAQDADKIESLGTVNIGGVNYRNGKVLK